jgi:DeoR family lactose phosphotransferase system repressor
MLKSERQDAIVRLVEGRGSVTVRDVAESLSVSEMTVRRDLDELASDQRLIRVHGGARSLNGKRGLVVPHEYSHSEKRTLHTTEKARVAKLAVSLVEDGDTIFLGTGTTVEIMAQRLPEAHLRVITNSLPVFNLLESRSCYDLCLVGGLYRPRTGAFVGPMAEDALGMLGIDKAFIGANGVLGTSVSTSNMEEGRLQQLAFDKADLRYLVADSSKLGKRDFFTFYELTDIDGLVTDTHITPEQREQLDQITTVIS